MKLTLSFVLSAIALAMGVASVVMLVIGTSSPENTAMLLALGLCCVAVDAIQRTRVAQMPGKTTTPASRRRK
jgi:hypothetical protein